MLLKKLKKEIEEGISLTRDALHEINTIFSVKRVPEKIVYHSGKGWDSLKRFLGSGKEEELEKKDWMYNSGLIYEPCAKKPKTLSEEEQAKPRSYEPDMQHLTDYQKKTSKVPPGFAFKSAYEVPVEPIEKKYKKKNPYKPED